MKKLNIKRTVGYGYVGKWRDETLGFFLPDQLAGHARHIGIEPVPHDRSWVYPEDVGYLCKITVEQVFAKNGRPITRRKRAE
jgi:hypothetical protein